MKEDYLNRKAKNLRNKLIFFIHSELKKKLKNNFYMVYLCAVNIGLHITWTLICDTEEYEDY